MLRIESMTAISSPMRAPFTTHNLCSGNRRSCIGIDDENSSEQTNTSTLLGKSLMKPFVGRTLSAIKIGNNSNSNDIFKNNIISVPAHLENNTINTEPIASNATYLAREPTSSFTNVEEIFRMKSNEVWEDNRDDNDFKTNECDVGSMWTLKRSNPIEESSSDSETDDYDDEIVMYSSPTKRHRVNELSWDDCLLSSSFDNEQSDASAISESFVISNNNTTSTNGILRFR